MNLIQTGQQATMSSIELLALINRERSAYGESEVRRNDFHARVRDELEGDNYETFVVKNSNSTESEAYMLTLQQCMYVAMRESKGVRRKVQSALEQKLRPAELSRMDILKLAMEAEQARIEAERKLEVARPKVQFFDRLVERKTLMSATQVAQKLGLSAVAMNKMLDELGVYSRNVKRARVFQQWFIDKGLGELKQTELGYSQPLFTTAGEAWVVERLTSEGVAV